MALFLTAIKHLLYQLWHKLLLHICKLTYLISCRIHFIIITECNVCVFLMGLHENCLSTNFNLFIILHCDYKLNVIRTIVIRSGLVIPSICADKPEIQPSGT